ncbi:MAG: hypothetical protein JW857_11920 [Bacteroidales bacterium]|nr:hypothetical protein [Bacteroidales bacterium]MBN2747175.1 hypothetical protein [Bacteroidales bacterium]
MNKIIDLSEEKKAELLELYYYKNVQLKELAARFEHPFHRVSKIISADILKRQGKPYDER